MKIDPYNHKELYLDWKERTKESIPSISKEDSDLIKQYLSDMERGINIAKGSVKGGRSFIRLNTLKEKMINFSKRLKSIYGVEKLTDVTEEQIISFFTDMRNGTLQKKGGGTFKSVEHYARVFKAFWHWHQKVSKKAGLEVTDITIDLDARGEKPDWVYLNEQEVKKLVENAKQEYRVLMMFLFDTGIRAPTELMNVKVSDLFNDYKELMISQEASKTFGRRIKLMLCGELLKDYVKDKGLQPSEYLFQTDPKIVNRYLKRLAAKLFGDKPSPAGARYSELTMYDFRHISCCYWLPRYKSESALKYRFGWKKSDKIHYYSEMLGMKDTISEDDMLVDLTKTEIEKRLETSEKEKEILKERVYTVEMQMAQVMQIASQMHLAINNEKAK